VDRRFWKGFDEFLYSSWLFTQPQLFFICLLLSSTQQAEFHVKAERADVGAAQRLKAKEDFSAALKAEPVRSARERSQVLHYSIDQGEEERMGWDVMWGRKAQTWQYLVVDRCTYLSTHHDLSSLSSYWQARDIKGKKEEEREREREREQRETKCMYLEDQRVITLLRRRVKQYSTNPLRSNVTDSQKDTPDFGRSKVRTGTAPVGGAGKGGRRTGSARAVDGDPAAALAAAGIAAERAEKMRLSALLLARKAAMRLRAEAQHRADKVEEALRRKAVQSEVKGTLL
jgi:hypothetical protein